jgi:putative transposase
MSEVNDSATYKKLPLHFIGDPNPLYSMLQWLTNRMMEVESELKVGASKGKHTLDRRTHFSGTRG